MRGPESPVGMRRPGSLLRMIGFGTAPVLDPVAPRPRRTVGARRFLCSTSWRAASAGGRMSICLTGVPVPPFGCAFSTASNVERVLAVANEEGFVRMYDTEAQMPSKHIFKGDQTAKVWDVQAGEILGACKGHQCSLKLVAFSRFEKAVFCTGGRDGNIMVWDTRCNKKDGFYRQVKQISGAYNVVDKQTPSKPKKKRQNLRGLTPLVDFQQSVTVVLLQDEHTTLISAGAVG